MADGGGKCKMQSPQYTQYIKSNFNCDYRNMKFIVSSGWMHAFFEETPHSNLSGNNKREQKEKKKEKKRRKKRGKKGGRNNN